MDDDHDMEEGREDDQTPVESGEGDNDDEERDMKRSLIGAWSGGGRSSSADKRNRRRRLLRYAKLRYGQSVELC